MQSLSWGESNESNVFMEKSKTLFKSPSTFPTTSRVSLMNCNKTDNDGMSASIYYYVYNILLLDR